MLLFEGYRCLPTPDDKHHRIDLRRWSERRSRHSQTTVQYEFPAPPVRPRDPPIHEALGHGTLQHKIGRLHPASP